MRPVVLGPNWPPRFFAGGDVAAQWRGLPGPGGPEDWVASTTPVLGRSLVGLTRLPGGALLRDAVAADPVAWLGAEHVAAWGPEPALLVKLLDAGQRLPVHCHPGRGFARRHLGCGWGKTEAWVVVGTRGPEPVVHLGFRSGLAADELAALVAEQRSEALLAALNTFRVSPGDTVLVPAGLPHAIGAGVFVVELQEPSDWSVLLEWDGFDLDGGADGHLGLGYETALQAVDRTAWNAERLAELTARRTEAGATPPGVEALFPLKADPYFRAERLHAAAGPIQLDAGYSVLAVLAGTGTLHTADGDGQALRPGQTILVPHAAGPTTLTGDANIVRSRPPHPRHAPKDDTA